MLSSMPTSMTWPNLSICTSVQWSVSSDSLASWDALSSCHTAMTMMMMMAHKAAPGGGFQVQSLLCVSLTVTTVVLAELAGTPSGSELGALPVLCLPGWHPMSVTASALCAYTPACPCAGNAAPSAGASRRPVLGRAPAASPGRVHKQRSTTHAFGMSVYSVIRYDKALRALVLLLAATPTLPFGGTHTHLHAQLEPLQGV